MKKIIEIITAMAMVFCLTACSSADMSKIKGDWTLSAINGKTVEQYAAEHGVDTYMAVINATVTDKEYTSTSALDTATYPISVKADGFEVLVSEGGDVLMSVKYDSANDTLTYSVDSAGTLYDFVFVKGTGDLTPVADDAADAEIREDSAAAA